MNMFVMALLLGGIGLSSYMQYQQGKEAEKARLANAALLEREALREKEVAGEQAREKRKETERMRARQIVLYAKSGVLPSVGTPLLVAKETKKRGERQAAIIQEHGEYAYSLKRSQAALERKYGRAEKKAGAWGAGASLATGLSTGYAQGIFG